MIHDIFDSETGVKKQICKCQNQNVHLFVQPVSLSSIPELITAAEVILQTSVWVWPFQCEISPVYILDILVNLELWSLHSSLTRHKNYFVGVTATFEGPIWTISKGILAWNRTKKNLSFLFREEGFFDKKTNKLVLLVFYLLRMIYSTVWLLV